MLCILFSHPWGIHAPSPDGCGARIRDGPVHGGPKGALPTAHARPTIQRRTKDPQPPWRRHGRGCGDRVKGPWRALSVPPQQDVVSGRPGRSGPGHGLPEGRLPGGALSLVPFFGQAKKGTRPRAMRAVRSASLEAGETVRKPVHLRKIKSFNGRLKPLSGTVGALFRPP